MSRRDVVPLLAGLAAAAAVFAVVALFAGGGGNDRGRTAPVGTRASGGGATVPERTGASVRRGAAVFAAMGCGSCHRLAAAGSSGPIGPDLDERVPAHTAASLRAFIVAPRSEVMPNDFGERMTDAQLDDLVAYLLAVAGG